MNQLFNKKITQLGFEQKIETLYSLVMDTKLNTTMNKWLVFAYYEDGKYYFSDNGDLVEMFDVPDIDIEYALDKIKESIKKFGCYLNVSKIVKEIDLNNLQRDFDNFVNAVISVDKLYNEI